MIKRLRSHIPLLVFAVVVGVVASGGPVAARAVYDAMNAKKVDGKMAVSSSASPSKRAGKLVATNRQGHLPNNIITKAPNADRLDGLDSKDLATRRSVNALDALPSTRLIGWGTVNSGGVLGEADFPGGSTAQTGTGSYSLTIPGYSPGCAADFPVVIATPQWSAGSVYAGSGIMTCATGDVTMYLNTTNSAGAATNMNWAFEVFSAVPFTSAAASKTPMRSGRQSVCVMRKAGVSCH